MAAPVWDKVRGIVGNLFQMGGPSGPNLKNTSGVIELRNATDAAFATGRAAHAAAGGNLNDLVTLFNLQSRLPNITFDFSGGSAPSPAAHTNEFMFVHTTGGPYTAGQVVYDDGTALIVVPTEVVKHLTSSTAVIGTISLIQNGLYAWQGSTWVLKGDGGATNTGISLWIEVPFAFGDEGTTVSSTAQIPTGARIVWSRIEVETVFDGSCDALLYLDGTANENLILAAENDLQTEGSYQNREGFLVIAGNTGVVSVDVGGSSVTVGVGRAWVEYVTPNV